MKMSKILRKHGQKDLCQITRILDEAGIQAFCEFGTLLGLVRDSHLLPFDYDLDIAVIQSNQFSWEKVETLLNAHGIAKEYSFVYKGKITEQRYRFPSGVPVDILLYEIADDNHMRCYIYFRDRLTTYAKEDEFSVKMYVFPFFKGLEKKRISQVSTPPPRTYMYYIPQNAERHLEDIYGSGWKTPDPNYRPDRTQNIMSDMGQLIS